MQGTGSAGDEHSKRLPAELVLGMLDVHEAGSCEQRSEVSDLALARAVGVRVEPAAVGAAGAEPEREPSVRLENPEMLSDPVSDG
jgi:hypothetical protein